MNIQSEYMSAIYKPTTFRKVVERMIEEIHFFKKEHPFDAIAFRGSSGAAVAYPLAYQMDIPMIHIRKGTNSSHCSFKIEGMYNAERIIIVDDFVESGSTLKTIMRRIYESYSKRQYTMPNVVGLFLYNHPDVTPDDNPEAFEKIVAAFKKYQTNTPEVIGFRYE